MGARGSVELVKPKVNEIHRFSYMETTVPGDLPIARVTDSTRDWPITLCIVKMFNTRRLANRGSV
jgi:hypothetical protein